MIPWCSSNKRPGGWGGKAAFIMEEADKRQEERGRKGGDGGGGGDGGNKQTETDGESTQRRQKIGGILEGGANTCLPTCDKSKVFLHSDLLSPLRRSQSFSNNSPNSTTHANRLKDESPAL